MSSQSDTKRSRQRIFKKMSKYGSKYIDVLQSIFSRKKFDMRWLYAFFNTLHYSNPEVQGSFCIFTYEICTKCTQNFNVINLC